MTWLLPISMMVALAAPGGPRIHRIDRNAFLEPAQYGFLDSVLAGVEVVSLGESIHLTHEFPLVRIGIVEYLNEHLGWHVVGLEGGPEDIWIAQDRFLASARSRVDADSALLGFVGVWNTPEVRSLLEYEAKSWHGPNPLYLTAYDVQPGIGRGSPGRAVFRQLADRIRRYAPADSGFDPIRWVDDLSPLADQCRRYQRSDQARIERAIALLERWVERARPHIESAFPLVPHALVATLIPVNLRASLRLCETLRGVDWDHYKGRRDAQAAPYALELKSRLPGQKLMIWAHLSHVFYDHEQYPIVSPAVGQLLRQALGPRLYTIMPLAEAGSALLINVDPTRSLGRTTAPPDGDVRYGRVHGANGDIGRVLSQLGPDDYFLDLRGLEPGSPTARALSSSGPVWVEGSAWQLTPALDFDGIIWIKRVHAPDWPAAKLVMLAVIGYRTELLGVGLAAVGVWIAWLVLRRRKQSRSAEARSGIA